MPIYEDDRLSREDLLDLRKKNRCKECGARLDVFLDVDCSKAFLACADWHRTHHEGIEREASRYQKEGLASLNIPTRRELMEQEFGTEKTKALDKYIGVVSLTKTQAKEILVAVFPEAPGPEIARAVMLCASYGLNPLMKHVFLIPFNEGTPKETWATVIGIKAKRLLASRRGNFSYVDNTPRVMTEEEQRTTFGEAYKDRLCVITKVKDPATGAEAPGYGFYLEKETCYGMDKGNSRFNMAAIRSESQALDRLRPGEMPVGFEVMPEEFIEGTYSEITPGSEVAKPKSNPPKQPKSPIEKPGDKEPEWSPEDKTPITPEQIKELDALMLKAGMDNKALGQFCNKEMEWGITQKPDLKKWHLDIIVAKIKKGLGELEPSGELEQ